MISLDVIEDSFIRKNANLYDLSALIGADRFSFLVLDKNQNVIVLRSYSLEEDKDAKSFIRKTYLQDEILKLNFASVKVAVNNSKHTLIPAEFFDEEEKPIYLENMVELLQTDTIGVDDLSFIDAKNVYAVNQEIQEMILESFDNMTLFHGSTAFIQGAYLLTDTQKDFQMYINVLNRKLNILLFEKNNLLFNNSFSFKNVKDFVYFVMLVMDQFKVNPETVPVYLCGQIMRESEIFKLLFRYIKNVDFLEAPDHLRFRSKYEALNAYKFFDLFSLRLCE
jgi:hypothetical protein